MSEKQEKIKEFFTNPDALQIMYLLATDGKISFKEKKVEKDE